LGLACKSFAAGKVGRPADLSGVTKEALVPGPGSRPIDLLTDEPTNRQAGSSAFLL
jgi:hypothetical protein